jgi:YVTN family beta-propeller protein
MLRQVSRGFLPQICALALCACNIDTTSVVEVESRLSVNSLFAINGNNSVTLGWTAPLPPGIPKRSAAGDAGVGHPVPADGPGDGGDPADAGVPERVLIHRGADHDFRISGATLLASVGAETNRYIDSTVVNGEIYYYRVVPVGRLAGGLEKYGEASAPAVGQPFDYSAVTTIRYGEHIQRIFTSSCAVSGCHVGGGADHHAAALKTVGGTGAGRSGAPEVRGSTDHPEPPGQFSLKSWADLMMGGNHGAVVVAYKATKSHLLFHVNDDTLLAPVSTPHMPLPGFQLPREQVEALFRWVNEGCANDAGAAPFTVFPEGRVLITNQAEDLVAVIDRATNLVARYVRAGAEDVFTTPPEAPHNVTVDEERGVYYVNLISAGKVLKYRLDTNELIDEVGGILAPTQVAVTSTGDTAFAAQFTPGINAIRILRTDPLALIGEVASPNVDKPHGVQITPDGTELWVTGNLSDNLMVVTLSDLSTRLIQLNNQPPGQGGVLLPYQTVMTPDNKKVYVTCQRSNTVVVVDRETDMVVKSIAVGENPLIPSITPDGSRVLVPNRNTDDVSVIDTQTDSVVATIADVGPQPHGSAITPDGRFAYIACENVTSAIPPHHPTVGSTTPGFFSVIDLATMSVTGSYEIGAFAAGVAITRR